MSKIKNAFSNGKAFIGFITAGDPSLDKTKEYIREMIRGGADLIEIGIPFSDPIAEGIVIQGANIRALSSGTTIEKIFKMVEEIRKEISVPLVFLTYLNPVYNYGYDKFFNKCNEIGVDGIIIPDLPFEEKGEINEIALKNNVDIISLISPTSKERIYSIAKESRGFVYIVSSMGVTGARNNIKTDISNTVDMVRKVTSTPCAVGFGINTPKQCREISKQSDGVIVGSAIVKIIENYGANAGEHVYKYVKEMKEVLV